MDGLGGQAAALVSASNPLHVLSGLLDVVFFTNGLRVVPVVRAAQSERLDVVYLDRLGDVAGR